MGSEMCIRDSTQPLHACFDYPFYLSLAVLPFLLGLGMSHPMAFVLPLVIGVAGLMMTALTDHRAGLVGVIPFRTHLFLDAAAGLGLIAGALSYGFAGLDLVVALAAGGMNLVLALAHRPDERVIPAE